MTPLLTLLNTTELKAYTTAGHWQDRTIYSQVAYHAGHAPNKVAVREQLRSVTYSELVDAADRLAASWRLAGVQPGQRIAVWLPSRVEVAIATLACSREGFVVCPSLHRDHTVHEVADLVKQMRASALIVQTGYGAGVDNIEIVDAVAGHDWLKSVHVLEALEAHEIFPDLPTRRMGPAEDDPNTVVYLAFTSGSTGRPKGVMHSDNTLLSPIRALAKDWTLDNRSCLYSLSPLSHNLGFGAMLLSLTTGAEFVIHDLPKGTSLADRLYETNANFVFGVPTHAIDLLSELREREQKLPELRGFRISGAAVPPVVAQGLIDIGVTPQSGYGMTEAGSHHYTLPSDDPYLIINSVGRACDGYEVAIFAQDDVERRLPPGEVGQIGGRGASLMLGYFDDQATTESSFNSKGWFLTGDLGWMDEDGYLRITGRKKDVIIRGGHNIFPAKIENLAMRHGSVAKAAAIPIDDERLGERVCLIVQPTTANVLDGPTILAHLAESGLSKYDMPEYFGTFEELPLTPSGKVLKDRIVEHIENGVIVPKPVRYTDR